MRLSIVVPIFNEEDSIPFLKERLRVLFNELPYDYEIICVNDGSTDKSSALIREWVDENHRISLIEFSRNFGHQQAITAGLKETKGDCVVILDADLQDPPEEIPKMVEKWKEGYKIIFAERLSRKEGVVRNLLFNLSYKIFAVVSDLPIVINSGVYGLMDRVVVNHLLNMGERNRFIPGMRGWIGFETTSIFYERQDRKAGKPRQTLRRLITYSLNAVFSFSYKPIRLISFIGFAVTTFFFIYGVVLIVMRMFNVNVAWGFTTPTIAIFFVGGLLLLSNGIVGEYVARIYDEVKKRPLYIIRRKISRKEDGNVIVDDFKEP